MAKMDLLRASPPKEQTSKCGCGEEKGYKEKELSQPPTLKISTNF
jgi:hypothetical protein